eukprot:s596_g19.t4
MSCGHAPPHLLRTAFTVGLGANSTWHALDGSASAVSVVSQHSATEWILDVGKDEAGRHRFLSTSTAQSPIARLGDSRPSTSTSRLLFCGRTWPGLWTPENTGGDQRIRPEDMPRVKPKPSGQRQHGTYRVLWLAKDVCHANLFVTRLRQSRGDCEAWKQQAFNKFNEAYFSWEKLGLALQSREMWMGRAWHFRRSAVVPFLGRRPVHETTI